MLINFKISNICFSYWNVRYYYYLKRLFIQLFSLFIVIHVGLIRKNGHASNVSRVIENM